MRGVARTLHTPDTAGLAFAPCQRKMRDPMPRTAATSLLAVDAATASGGERRRALAQVEQALSDQVGPWQVAMRTARGETSARNRRSKRTTRR